MAVRFIRKGEDPVLRTVAHPVKKISPVIHRLLDDMLDTLRYSDNGLALAAPQIGISKRLIVIEFGEKIFQLINPRVVESSSETEVAVEGCLSFPDVWGEVERAQRVVVEAQDRDGEPVTLEAEGILARALQHEIDHLDGVLFIDKVIRFVEFDDEESEE
ncbi:MAG: peptide deformylase [Bacillota bacterium]|jgi:peptide deformylase